MTQKDQCPHCGAGLPVEAPEGLCPKCMMKSLVESNVAAARDTLTQIEGPGTKIGNYELIELIGEGGMGLVYLARQQEPKRKVALKIVKLGMDTRQVVARFEAERQTLALLAHPNIAHVFDAGTTETGRPYFVMEYVEGKSITKYCDEQTSSVEQRLELFQQVCEGVHHAHQKGIIHRDLKPSNILVSVHGDRAVPKIIDFGIAKAIAQPLLTEKTSYTEHGQLLGTPEYMSPEQAEMATEDIDTRSDIYSLGVLLYELLAGATPFDAKRLRKGGIDNIQQVICQEEPRTPSARLTSLGDKAKTVAERRRTQIITLTRRLHRELEWIPMKAMRKDRTRRYRSASELSDDIQNYLTGVPLIAGPESNVYRARKFVHKHAGFVASAALVAVVIIVGLITSTAFSFSAEKARGQEAAARVEAEQAREKEAAARTQAEEARDKEAALRAQVEQALARAERAEKTADEQRKLAEERAEEYRRSLYTKNLALAEVAHTANDFAHMRKLLESCPKDLRAWEWDRLNYISNQSSMTIQGYGGWGGDLALSPDGKRIVSSGIGSAVKVWDTATGAELMSLEGLVVPALNPRFSPDGKRIISGSWDGTIIVWDGENTKQLMTLKGHEGPCSSYFSPDGKRIISGGMDGNLKVWNAETGVELRSWNAHRISMNREAGVYSFHAISPNGKTIASGGRNGTIKLWDATTGIELKVLRGHQGQKLREIVRFSSDGKRIVSGSYDGTVRVWDTATGEELMTLSGHKAGVESVAFDHQDRRIISGSDDHTVKVWDAQTGVEVMTLQGHTDVVLGVAFSKDGKRIISGSRDGTIKIWEPGVDHTAPLTLEGLHRGRMAFSPDGKQIVTGSGDKNKTIQVWNAVTGNEVLKINHPGDCVSFSPDGKRIAATDGNDIQVWDVSSCKELMTLSGHERGIESISYSPDGTKIVSGGKDKTVRVWDAMTGVEIMTLREHGAEAVEWYEKLVSSVAFSPDGKRIIISGSFNNKVRIWDVETGVKVMTLEHPQWVSDIAFSPDGKQIASAGAHSLLIWDATTGSKLLSLAVDRGFYHEVISVAFSPDGKRVVSGSKEGTIKIWDAKSGLEITRLRIDGNVKAVSFSPDGKTLATASIIGKGTGNKVTLWKSAGATKGDEVTEDTEKQKKEPSSPTTVPVTDRSSTDDTAASDLDRLQGTWVGTVLDPEGRGIKVKWTFSGNSFHNVRGIWWTKGIFTLNEEALPKQVDFTTKEVSMPPISQSVGRTEKKIYELKDGSLTLASGRGRVLQLERQVPNEE
jgi:eukaryotic-like serine/threonine-protein kinase